MKLFTLAALLLSASLAVAQNTRPADTGKANALEGMWTVVAAEKNGEAMPDAKDMTVTMKDGVLTCECPKTKMTAKMEFSGPGKARVTIVEGKEAEKGQAKEAVYVLTNDYLAICVHGDKTTDGGEKPKDTNVTAGFQPTTKSECSFVLKRGEPK